MALKWRQGRVRPDINNGGLGIFYCVHEKALSLFYLLKVNPYFMAHKKPSLMLFSFTDNIIRKVLIIVKMAIVIY